MKRTVFFTVTMVLLASARAAELQGPMAALDEKITQSLASDKWNYAFYFGSHAAPPDKWLPLTKLNKE